MAINLTDENFESEIKNIGKLALVDFYATWCEPCSMLAPVLEKVAEEMKESIVLLKANLDNVPKTADKFGVEKIPTVILFKNGLPISGFVGLAQKSAIKEWIKTSQISPEKEQEEIKQKEEKIEEAKEGIDIAEISERYGNYAKSNGFRLNPDNKTVERVIYGLLANEKKYGKKYCPCRRVTGIEDKDAKIICPCAFHKEEIEKDGHCFCNLFVK